jgi:small subunit ribosomal protein S1
MIQSPPSTSGEFAKMLEESLVHTNLKSGSVVSAEVIEIKADHVVLHAGYKSESIIPADQFKDDNGDLEVAVGDMVDVVLDSVENGHGETKLSREKAKRAVSWRDLEKAFTEKETVTGMISGKVKGGFTVEVQGIRAFLPGSLIDVRPIRDTSYLETKLLELKVIKIDAKRNNVVVSRRAVLEEESHADREVLLQNLEEGKKIKGIVKNLTDYGAFVDLGGIDGLLHITDMAWKRVKHPSEVIGVGEEIDVMVLKFDKEKSRVSLGLKQLDEDPWSNLADRFPLNARLQGKVTNIADYGCFVEIGDGIEGLVHVSEMDWTNKNIHPSKVVKLGEEVEVMVLEVEADRRRISLGIKQCQDNPWASFDKTHQVGQQVSGKIKSLTDFGIFIGLSGNIDGLIHLSDISWDEDGEELIRQYKKGDDVNAIILAIDPERERVSLGVKQLVDDPVGQYLTEHGKGGIVSGEIIEVTPEVVMVQLADAVMGKLPAAEIDRENADGATAQFKAGDEVSAKIVAIEKAPRAILLSIKAMDADNEAKVLKKLAKAKPDSSTNTTLGDLFQAQIDRQGE